MPYVNGQYMVTPQATVNVNDSALLAPASAPGYGLLLIGPATDGEPQTAITLSSPSQAVNVLKGGDLLQGVLNAFNPSNEVEGPGSITVIRPEQATQSTVTVDNATGGTAAMDLTTTSYGAESILSKVQITAGAPGYNVTMGTDFTGPGGQTYSPSSDQDIALSVLSIYYSGTGTSPTYTVSDTGLVLTATTSDIGGTITFTSTMTVQQLVNQINALAGWNATVLDPNTTDLVQALFDNVATAAAVGTTSATATTLYANVTAVVRWINAVGTFFTAVRQANAASLITSSSYLYAAGGTTPTAANSDWQNAYTLAQSLTGIDIVCPVIGSASIWTMNDAHCHYMSSLGQPRRGYVGDVTGQTVAQEITNAQALNSNRTSLVWPGSKGVDYNGNATTFASYIVAAQVAGMRSGAQIPGKITATSLVSQGLETTLSPAQVAQLNAAGIASLKNSQTGNVELSWDRTTWLQTTAYDKVENLTGMALDIVATALNGVLKQFVGQPVTASLLGHIKGEMLAELNNFYQLGFLSAAPASSAITLSANGQVVSGSANVQVIVPGNYIVVTLNATAFAA